MVSALADAQTGELLRENDSSDVCPEGGTQVYGNRSGNDGGNDDQF